MSLQEDVSKIHKYVVGATEEFLKKHNGGALPKAEEVLEHGSSFEFPELQVGEISSSFFVWRKKHVLVFHVHWAKDGTTVKSDELSEDKWPMQLKMQLAQSIELRQPNGTSHKIL